ncbi:MAG TPA: polyprenyl synthetase family protein [Candidatus Hydrogenedentes bacterium]|nr:polyprenyl synthetase family protein [Candidatus Hydrogenedentota bacterium]
MTLKHFLNEKKRRVEEALATSLQNNPSAPAELVTAMRYSLEAGGKRLRPVLMLSACELACGSDEPALQAACAMEMIHTYSLIHDDLPAMDNDDLRRGRPSSHKQFGEATAILAGDALLTLAFFEAARCGRLDVVLEFADAAGINGMVGGQYRDMEGEGKTLTLDELQRVHAGKTGALITASLRIGALLGNAAPEVLHALTHYGRLLGLLFQITDDVLDVVGDAATLGKSVGKDARTKKATYPALLGLDGALAMARATADRAVDALQDLGPEADIFRELARHLPDRNQ